MAEPKKKMSKTRTNRRRAQYKATAMGFMLCSNCQKPCLPHTVCAHCGYYGGEMVVGQAPTKRIVLQDEAQK